MLEDLCKNNFDAKNNDTSNQQLSLIRQCTAAALNIAASGDLGGSCDKRLRKKGRLFDISDLFATCCGIAPVALADSAAPADPAVSICEAGLRGQAISATSCIDALDAFNQDSNTIPDFSDYCPNTLTCADGSTLVKSPPCKGNPTDCGLANGNGAVNSGRNLGPR